MKFILALLLTFTILGDLSAVEGESSFSNCEVSSACDLTDYHAETSNEQDAEDSHHCHCHAGHSHFAVKNAKVLVTKTEISSFKVSFSSFKLGKLSSYHFRINRPPIS